MKKCCISLSFDDGRDDNFSIVLPILEKYGIKATFNITTGYIDGELKNMPSPRSAMTWEQVNIIREKGHEIAGHGHMHLNTTDDITMGAKLLGGGKIGFASPGTGFKKSEENEVILKKTGIQYIRLSMRYFRNEKWKVLCRKMSRILHNRLFSFLYKIAYADTCMDSFENLYVYSVPIMHDTTYYQIKSLVNYAVKNNKILVLMFHSVLPRSAKGYDDIWSYDEKSFDRICYLLSQYEQKSLCKVLPTIDLTK